MKYCELYEFKNYGSQMLLIYLFFGVPGYPHGGNSPNMMV